MTGLRTKRERRPSSLATWKQRAGLRRPAQIGALGEPHPQRRRHGRRDRTGPRVEHWGRSEFALRGGADRCDLCHGYGYFRPMGAPRMGDGATRAGGAESLVINAFRRLAPPRPLPCPHPAVMLLTKLSYWHIAGCDEDLVGRYGGTDPLFRHKTSVMRSCTTTHAANLGDMTLLQVIKRNGGPRKTKANGNKKIGLVAAKINGTRPWATSAPLVVRGVLPTRAASASVPAPTPVLAPAPTKATSGTAPSQRRGLMVETLDNQATEVAGESLHLCIATQRRVHSLLVCFVLIGISPRPEPG